MGLIFARNCPCSGRSNFNSQHKIVLDDIRLDNLILLMFTFCGGVLLMLSKATHTGKNVTDCLNMDKQ